MCLSSVHPVEIDKGHTDYTIESYNYSLTKYQFSQSLKNFYYNCVYIREREWIQVIIHLVPKLVNSTLSSMAELFEKLRLFFFKASW